MTVVSLIFYVSSCFCILFLLYELKYIFIHKFIFIFSYSFFSSKNVLVCIVYPCCIIYSINHYETQTSWFLINRFFYPDTSGAQTFDSIESKTVTYRGCFLIWHTIGCFGAEVSMKWRFGDIHFGSWPFWRYDDDMSNN